MKGFLYSIFGLLLFLSFTKEKEIVYTPEFIYSEVFEDNYAVVEIDETGVIAPLGEGLFSNSQGKTRRTIVSVTKVNLYSKFNTTKVSWFAQALSSVDVKIKSIAQTLFYKSTYHRLHLFLFILI